MMRRSPIIMLLVLIATTSLAAPPPVNPADPIAFMNQLWNRAVELLDALGSDSCSTMILTAPVLLDLLSAAIGEAQVRRSSGNS